MKKIDTTKLTPSTMMTLGQRYAEETKRLTQLKASGNMRHDPVFKECEEAVQRMEIEVMKARGADALVSVAGELLAFVEELVEQYDRAASTTLDEMIEVQGRALAKKARKG